MTWQVGDRAIVVNCSYWSHCGEIVTLVRQVRADEYGAEMKGEWVLDVPPPPGFLYSCCHERYLKPIPDEYDGLQVTTWDEGPWQPEVVTV